MSTFLGAQASRPHVLYLFGHVSAQLNVVLLIPTFDD